MKQCSRCGTFQQEYAAFCTRCGHSFLAPQQQTSPEDVYYPAVQSQRVLIACAALLLGTFGVHRFLLRKPVSGVLYLLLFGLSVLAWPSGLMTAILGIIEGIRFFCLTDEQFLEVYGL